MILKTSLAFGQSIKKIFPQHTHLPTENSVQEPTLNCHNFLSTIKEHCRDVQSSIQHHNDSDCGLYVPKNLKTYQFVFFEKLTNTDYNTGMKNPLRF